MVIEQILNLEREDVLASGDNHVVIAAIDEPQPGLVEMPGVAGGQQPVDDFLVPAIGVPGKAQAARHEQGAHPPGFGDLAAMFVIAGQPATDGRAADGARRGTKFLRRRDGGSRHLSRAVQVVQHVAERLGGTAAQVRRQRRAGGENDCQRRGVVLGERLGAQVEDTL